MINEETLFKVLPHGSGIDCDWRFERTKQSIRAYNSFHCMDEIGYYDGYQNFVVIFPNSDPHNFRLQFTGNRRGERKYHLREYLEDTIYWALKEIPETIA